MRYVVLTLITAAYGLTAQAGGIAFKKTYGGNSPISGTKITLAFSDSERTVSIDTENTLGHEERLFVKPISRTKFETIFELREESEEGTPVLKLITTGDCQIVEQLALVFPSGVSTILKATSRD